MKDKTSTSDSGINAKITISKLSNQTSNELSSESIKNSSEFNEMLLASLPYPAMYVRRANRTVIAANKLAIELGAKIGSPCWKEFGKSKFIADPEVNPIKIDNDIPNSKPLIQCSFCRGDECIFEDPCQNNPRVQAFDKIWDTYWIKVSDEIFLHYLIDITDKIKLENSLLESEQFLRKTQEIAMLGTYDMDLETGIWLSSDILDKLLGIEKKASKTIEDWVNIVHPAMREEMNNYFHNEVLAKNMIFDKEYKIIRQNDGQVRWLKGLGDLKFDSQGKAVRMIGTIHDITEKKHEQQQIIRNLRFTEVLLKSIPIPVFFLDSTGRYTGSNKAFTKQLGLSNNQIKGKTVLELWPSEHAEELYQKDLKILEDKKIQKTETTIIDKQGNKRDVIMIKNVFYDETGDVAGIVGTYIDITEQKDVENILRKSEQKYKLLSENVTDGIFTCKDNTIKYVNLSMNRIFRYDENELENTKLIDLISDDDRDDFESLMKFDTKLNQVINTEIKCVRKDKSVFFGDVYLNYVASESLTYGVIQDITEKKQLQEENIVNAILQTEEKERSNFSKELHDGLGPLLSTIKLYLQWSLRPMMGRSRKKIIRKAEEIVEESLNAVKEISNRLSPHLLSNYGLTSAIQSFVNKIKDTNAIKIDFQTNMNTRTDMKIENALYRVIIECVNNTIKYANAKHIYIKIVCSETKIKVQYMDDGRGFDIFKKLSEKKGLGLFNIQNRIQNLGGDIKMYSNRREGVNYQMTIPLKNKLQTEK